MQVWHRTENNTRNAIVSFFIDETEENYINDFFAGLLPHTWMVEDVREIK